MDLWWSRGQAGKRNLCQEQGPNGVWPEIHWRRLQAMMPQGQWFIPQKRLLSTNSQPRSSGLGIQWFNQWDRPDCFSQGADLPDSLAECRGRVGFACEITEAGAVGR